MSYLCWIRRDLRLHDHAALARATSLGETTLVFVFDPHILDRLSNKNDRRVSFLYESLMELEVELQKKGSSLLIQYGNPEEIIPAVAKKLKVKSVFCNRDYEPYAKERDGLVEKALVADGIQFEQSKDSVFFEKHEILTGSGDHYKVFTPYKNKWLEAFEAQDKEIPNYKIQLKNLRVWENPLSICAHDWYKTIGFKETPPLLTGGTKQALKRLKSFPDVLPEYHEARNYPATPGTSLLSVYLRHGNLSVRDMIRTATSSRSEGAKTWLSEIIWRDFYQMILDVHPQIVNRAFKPDYEKIKWKGKEEHFQAWCKGETGYPIIDSAMKCLNETGMMHNRLRMIVASFLCKTLLVDYKKGEHYFAEKLVDFDLAANNGGWQWSSSTGCDAQPYFRIFNPYTQSEKFDSEGKFIKTWLPELKTLDGKALHHGDSRFYPRPIVNYAEQREKALLMYSVVSKK